MRIFTRIIIAFFLSHSLNAQYSWLNVHCGSQFSLALRDDSTLWSWGFNGNGQLGINSTATQHLPTQIGTDYSWRKVAVGSHHSLGILSDGTLWSWGFNSVGQLGTGI
jgi:alpha-tubulin suppressor-like RCC1 family protein